MMRSLILISAVLGALGGRHFSSDYSSATSSDYSSAMGGLMANYVTPNTVILNLTNSMGSWGTWWAANVSTDTWWAANASTDTWSSDYTTSDLMSTVSLLNQSVSIPQALVDFSSTRFNVSTINVFPDTTGFWAVKTTVQFEFFDRLEGSLKTMFGGGSR